MGELPDWYTLIRSAKYLGVPPWDLLDKPIIWQSWAAEAEAAEAQAEAQISANNSRKSGLGIR